MTIHPATSKEYTTIKAEFVADYIMEYLQKANDIINNSPKVLKDCNKAQLNATAAELETVCKRLDYILNGNY